MHRPLWETMLNATEVGVTTHFLDVGCGGGGAKISGLDAAEGLIVFARERVSNGDFRVGDIENLPFEDDAFDVVFAANSVQYSGDRIAALRELGRVCKPEGRIVAGLFGPPEKVAFSAIQKAIRDSLPEPPTGAGPYELSSPGKLDGLFSEAGLNVLESGEVDCPFKYPDFETYWQAQFSTGPLQSALRVISEEQLKTTARDAAKAFRLDNGAILIQPNIFIYLVAAL